MSVRFLGLALWQGLLLGAAFAALTWWLYRREVRMRRQNVSWLLPLLRTVMVFFILLMLTGPVLHHRKIIGQLSRVLVFVDESASMSRTDKDMAAQRKLLNLQHLGWLPAGELDSSYHDAAEQLAAAQRRVSALAGAAETEQRVNEAAAAFVRHVKAAAAAVAQAPAVATPGVTAIARRGSISRQVWTGVSGGGAVATLLQHTDYPAKPTQTGTLDKFESPQNTGDNYGQRIRGYVLPPVDGAYRFFIVSDDNSELWLSKDDDPGRAVKIAECGVAGGVDKWDESRPMASDPVQLKQGQAYYIEALHKEGNGNDFVAVGWRLPDGTNERPIPGTRLAPYDDANSDLAGLSTNIAEAYRVDLLTPAEQLAAPVTDKDKQPQRIKDLNALSTAAARWEQRFRKAFAVQAGQVIARNDPAVSDAIARFDQSSRWQRAETSLLIGDDSLLARLSQRHHVEFLSLQGPEAQVLWSSQQSVERPQKLDPATPQGPVTDLSDGVRAHVSALGGIEPTGDQTGRAAEASGQRMAVVLLTDGQHNSGGSPIQVAKILGNRNVPVFTVGMGDTEPPTDLAVLDVEGPESVFIEDRVKGRIVLEDNMPPGKPFMARVQLDGKLLWEKRLVTTKTGRRHVDFDFPIKELVEARVQSKSDQMQVLSLPLAMKVSVDTLVGESEKQNNQAPLRVRAVTNRRTVLMMDGRPRWEFRYVRNLFQRDEQWEVNELLPGVGSDAGRWQRGDKHGTFPETREALYAYDLIVFGEVPRRLLSDEELEWIRDFAARRGGGLVFIDGQRDKLKAYADSPIGPMLPVEWEGDDPSDRPSGLKLTKDGQGLAPLRLALAADDMDNQELWRKLRPPHHVRLVRALPGTETLVEAVMTGHTAPALVLRRFGAGKVLYSAFDESWRWRYEVADRYHQRYWNQIANWAMEPPYSVRDKFVSIDAGGITYMAGQSAQIRVRLRDDQGQPVMQATAEAVLYKDGQLFGSVPLAGDNDKSGVFRGKTDKLPAGQYEVAVRVTGMADSDLTARAEFAVQPHDTGELTVLHCDEALLRQVAANSSGDYFREEDLGALADRLEPLSQGSIVESETVLWQSYWWFVPLVALLTCEWLIRKRAGLI